MGARLRCNRDRVRAADLGTDAAKAMQQLRPAPGTCNKSWDHLIGFKVEKRPSFGPVPDDATSNGRTVDGIRPAQDSSRSKTVADRFCSDVDSRQLH